MAIKISFQYGKPRPRDTRTGKFVSWDRAWKSSTFRKSFKDAFTSTFRKAQAAKKVEKLKEKITVKEVKKKILTPSSPYYSPTDVLNEFLENFEINEFEFGLSYHDGPTLKMPGKKTTIKLSYIKDFKHLDPETKWLFSTKQPNWHYKPKRVVVWYLLYMPDREAYNIVPWTVNNYDKLTLKKLLKIINRDFINNASEYFMRKGELDGQDPLESQEIVFITPYEKYKTNPSRR